MAREGMVLSTSTLLPLRRREGAARPWAQSVKTVEIESQEQAWWPQTKAASECIRTPRRA